MKFARLMPVFLITALALAACGKDEPADQAADAAAAGNSLLALVPADTPYLGGNLAPVPDAVIDSYLSRFEPALESLQVELTEARAELESNPDELADDDGARVVHALLQELDGKLNRAGLESLGFDLSAEQVVYGISAFPVMRATLSDAAALRATVQRVLDNAGMEAPELEFQGQSYWRIVPDMHESVTGDLSDVYGDGAEDETGAPASDQEEESGVAIYIAILPDHLAFGMLPLESESEVLPAFLALEKPADSMAAQQLADINQRFGYSAYGTGVLDLQKFADELLNADSLVGRLLASHGHDVAAAATDQCRAEISSIIANTPYFYTGMKELSETVVENQLVVETAPSIATELMSLVSDVPVANAASSYLAELALGLKVGPVRDFLRSKAMAVVEQPYQCEFLQDLNNHAQNASDQLNQPIPPMFNNLLGLRAAISRFGRGQDAPESAEGMIALHVTQPEMLVGMAQMLVPSLAELNLAPGEPPVQVPSDMLPVPGLVLYAAQSESALGISVGEGQQNGLADFINQKAKANGTFLSFNYDTATYLDMSGQLGNDALDSGDSSASSFAESAKEVYQSMADRSDTRFSFTKDGLVIDSKMTFKNP